MKCTSEWFVPAHNVPGQWYVTNFKHSFVNSLDDRFSSKKVICQILAPVCYASQCMFLSRLAMHGLTSGKAEKRT